MRWNQVTGVILAAGKGSRMSALGVEYPKPLLPICNEPLLVAHMRSMAALGIRKVVVVIGHLGDRVVEELASHPVEGLACTFVRQEHQLGIAHAVGQLERLVEGPMLLFLGDIFFRSSMLLPSMIDLMPADGDGAVLAVIDEPSVEAIRKNYTVDLAPDGLVTRVIEKPRVVRTQLKGCGLYLFGPTIFDAIRRTPRTAARDEYEITESIQILIDAGGRVRVAPVIERDVNLTFPHDLLDCNLDQLASLGMRNLVATGASVHPGAVLDRCIVAQGVALTAPVHLDRCVLLPGARLERQVALQRSIVTATQTIQC